MLYIPAEEGQALVDYGLILVLIFLAILAALVFLGEQLANLYGTILERFERLVG